MKNIVYLFLIILSGCAVFQPDVEDVFRPYVRKFEKVSGKRNTVDIRFGSLAPPLRVGECRALYGHSKIIIIDKYYWAKISDNIKQRLISHELGHCVLGLRHNDNPESVMYPIVGE